MFYQWNKNAKAKNIIRVKMRKSYKHDASKKKNESRGRGATVFMGVQKIKNKKRTGARVGLGFGPVWPTNLGSGQEEYIRVETHFFPHFSFSFSLLSSLSSVLSLLSPPSLTFSDEKDGGRRRRRRGGRPFLDGGAAAANVFFFFRSSSSTPSPLCFSGLKISKLFIKMPRSKKRKKGNLYFCFFFFVFWFWYSDAWVGNGCVAIRPSLCVDGSRCVCDGFVFVHKSRIRLCVVQSFFVIEGLKEADLMIV